ncbi:MAG: asparagine synthase (glutamine-hydrolyzing) [Rhizobiaceae bacterium]
MCGIWCSIGVEPDPKHIDRVSHRGPDGRGWKVAATPAGPLALGHRRLSIIDLSDAGLQPMSYADGRYWIVLNGEIYNYLELRAELEAAGRRFVSNSDTEVLLAAYAEWGEDALERLLGMFAFILWDVERHRVVAARDRFGIKPLYCWTSAGGIAFASEIKQFIGLPGFSARINPAIALDFLAEGMLDHTDETLFAGVRQVSGGGIMRIELSGGLRTEQRRWYSLPGPGTLDIGEAEAARRFRDLLGDSVRLHMRSDVTVGSCLSGGLDSSSVVALMSEELERSGSKGRVNSVTATYPDSVIDERAFAQEVVDRFDCVAHWVEPRAGDVIDLFERVTWHQDEPFGSTSLFAQWLVFREAREKGITVMLDGQGADEQLAGYHSLFGQRLADLVRGGRFATFARTIHDRHRWHGAGLASQLRDTVFHLLPGAVQQRVRRRRIVAEQQGWLGRDASNAFPDRSALNVARQRLGVTGEGIGEACVTMLGASQLPKLLHWEDRNSMAHGIEARVPFLDHRLVEFSVALGDRHKFVGGDTKRVLRRGMADLLPPRVAGRRDKLGFATPEAEWFRSGLSDVVRDGVDAGATRFPGLIDSRGARAYADAVLTGKRPRNFALWRIASLGLWGKVFSVSG